MLSARRIHALRSSGAGSSTAITITSRRPSRPRSHGIWTPRSPKSWRRDTTAPRLGGRLGPGRAWPLPPARNQPRRPSACGRPFTVESEVIGLAEPGPDLVTAGRLRADGRADIDAEAISDPPSTGPRRAACERGAQIGIRSRVGACRCNTPARPGPDRGDLRAPRPWSRVFHQPADTDLP